MITDWSVIVTYGVDTVIDLEGGLDQCIPTVLNGCLYVYFPIYDEQLPDPCKLAAVVALGSEGPALGNWYPPELVKQLIDGLRKAGLDGMR